MKELAIFITRFGVKLLPKLNIIAKMVYKVYKLTCGYYILNYA